MLTNSLRPATSCEPIHPIEMEGTTVGEMAKALDAFYSDSLNRRIPIVAALQRVKMKHDGATRQALEDQAAKRRGAFNMQH
jgi:hypothetical protein